MKVKHVAGGSFVNDSERLAFERIKAGLISRKGNDTWWVLTNLAFSATPRLQAAEIDIVAVGPPGVRIVEVKHWSAEWIDDRANLPSLEKAADLITAKSKKIATTLRMSLPDVGLVDGAILLTDGSEAPSRHKMARGVPIFTLKGWDDAIGLNGEPRLSASEAEIACRILAPRGTGMLKGPPRLLAGYTGFVPLSDPESRFHRIYRALHAARQEAVIFHLYDLSATDEPKAETRAQREYWSLQRLQKRSWVPRIFESFQDVPGYQDELFFFTLADPAAPTLKERAEDATWTSKARVEFARAAIRAVHEMHVEGGDSPTEPMLHRSLSPDTILVRHDNTPILTAFKHARIPAHTTVASLSATDSIGEVAAPEIRAQGLGAADPRSDTYSLCASLTLLFEGRGGVLPRKAVSVLDSGRAEDPESRSGLDALEKELSDLIGKPATIAPPSETRYWSEGQIVAFRNRNYRIVSALGAAKGGTAFKVAEVDKETGNDIGTYVARVASEQEDGERVLRAHNLVRPHIARHAGYSAIFEVADEWAGNGIVALMTWVEGTPLNEWVGLMPLLFDEQDGGDRSTEDLAVRWLTTVCESLGILHGNGLVHGDVCPKNLILSGGDLVLTGYGCAVPSGSPASSPGTGGYNPSPKEGKGNRSPSDDLYALATSMFHVLYDRKPPAHGNVKAGAGALDWTGLPRDNHPQLAAFFEQATNVDQKGRFTSAKEAVNALTQGSPPKA